MDLKVWLRKYTQIKILRKFLKIVRFPFVKILLNIWVSSTLDLTHWNVRGTGQWENVSEPNMKKSVTGQLQLNPKISSWTRDKVSEPDTVTQ